MDRCAITAFVAMLTLPIACIDQKKTPTPFDTDWSSCGFPPTVADDVNSGWAKLRVTVNEDGAPVWVVPIAASDPAFMDHATRCVVRERFEPALTEQGTPVKEQVTMKMNFVR